MKQALGGRRVCRTAAGSLHTRGTRHAGQPGVWAEWRGMGVGVLECCGQ